MLLVKLYFTPVLLLLVLSCLWQASQSTPVMSKGPMTDSCVLYAWALLHNITDVLTQPQYNEKLFNAINCKKQNVELNMNTQTTHACAPKESKCPGITESEFNHDSCLTNIGEDLLHYYRFLAAQPDPDSLLGRTVLSSLRNLMENCFTWTQPTDLTLEQAAANRPSTFDERLSLCKVLKGFQVRTITINRIIGYMYSSEHAK